MTRADFVLAALAAPAAAGGEEPDLATAVAAFTAGGGPAEFRATVLLGVLTGASAGVALADLVRSDGAAAIASAITAFDFAVLSARRLIVARRISLPPTPAADSIDGRALAGALYRAGLPPGGGTYEVDTMFDRLLTRTVRKQMSAAVDARYGPSARPAYARAVKRIMDDLHRLYAP